MRFYRFYRFGHLPNEGGMNRQPAKLLDAFEVIDNEFEKLKELDENAKRRYGK